MTTVEQLSDLTNKLFAAHSELTEAIDISRGHRPPLDVAVAQALRDTMSLVGLMAITLELIIKEGKTK